MTTTPTSCRSCGAALLHPVLDLGRTPLANSLLKPDRLDLPEPAYPLELAFCPACTLVQITETVPPETLFSEYLYFSSYSDTMLRHAEAIARRMAATRGLGAGSLVVEVASNDGYLLQYYTQAGIPVLGIEPAANIARVARDRRGIPTRCEFFGLESARRMRAEGLRADVLHANNVLAHVADLNGFVEGIRTLLGESGVAVIEAPYVRDLIERVEFDTIYHEHLCYFSFTALDRLFDRHGLRILDAERIPIHGGSLRLFAAAPAAGGRRTPAAEALLEEERVWGAERPDVYVRFANRVRALRDRLVETIRDLKRDGARIAAYGASAKGCTLLNYCGLGRAELDFVVDRSAVKQGLYTPGTRLPIHDPERLLEDRPDYVLLLTWNFADEILAQQSEYRRRGGRFILPVPDVRIV